MNGISLDSPTLCWHLPFYLDMVGAVIFLVVGRLVEICEFGLVDGRGIGSDDPGADWR